jgi:hypothetical protein
VEVDVTSNMGNAQAGDTVVFFGSDIIGRGDDRQLGGVHRVRVKSILLMNDGVRMVGRESPVLEELRRLIAQGVEVLACGTCLERLGLTDSVGVGTVSNMYDMTDAMLKAAKVISL